MKEMPNYYSVIPAEVRYDNNLRDKSKLLYGEISSLCNKNGCCFATNQYFAELYKVSKTTISILIKELVDNGYIISEIEYKEGTKEILNRYLRIVKGGYLRKLNGGIKEKLKDNNTRDNNTSINKKENIKRKIFEKPTIEEIDLYCKDRNNNISAEMFYDFYESKDWYVGKNKMKDWKACIRTWEKRNPKSNEPKWLNKKIDKQQISIEEQKELEDMFKEFN